jgi:hypothetical protein
VLYIALRLANAWICHGRSFEHKAHRRSTETREEKNVLPIHNCRESSHLNTRSDLLYIIHQGSHLRPTAWPVPQITALIPWPYFP